MSSSYIISAIGAIAIIVAIVYYMRKRSASQSAQSTVRASYGVQIPDVTPNNVPLNTNWIISTGFKYCIVSPIFNQQTQMFVGGKLQNVELKYKDNSPPDLYFDNTQMNVRWTSIQTPQGVKYVGNFTNPDVMAPYEQLQITNFSDARFAYNLCTTGYNGPLLGISTGFITDD